MDTQDIVDKWRKEAIEEGVSQGRQQGLESGLARALVRFYETRFGAMPAELRKLIEDTHDERTLEEWITLAAAASADDIAAAIRASRAS